ncbi:hypothetical protein GPALN_004172 [Globodera pallida]|nr:hypothetical protein GPALN_004172 [Globodera pallida]
MTLVFSFLFIPCLLCSAAFCSFSYCLTTCKFFKTSRGFQLFQRLFAKHCGSRGCFGRFNHERAGTLINPQEESGGPAPEPAKEDLPDGQAAPSHGVRRPWVGSQRQQPVRKAGRLNYLMRQLEREIGGARRSVHRIRTGRGAVEAQVNVV